jgi:hypothetical protein
VRAVRITTNASGPGINTATAATATKLRKVSMAAIVSS